MLLVVIRTKIMGAACGVTVVDIKTVNTFPKLQRKMINLFIFFFWQAAASKPNKSNKLCCEDIKVQKKNNNNKKVT